MKAPRVIECLNEALHQILAEDERVVVLGEDLIDPYGGAFKATRGLSTKFPERVIATPLSEGGFVHVAAGLALSGDRPIVEIMFGDFAALAFDALVNFASKSTAMYGRDVPLSMVVRCTVGGNRGDGPTHSQCLQKHFIGVPGLELFELTPFDDCVELLRRLTGLGRPCMLFEDKILYTQPRLAGPTIGDLFQLERIAAYHPWHRVFSSEMRGPPTVLVAPGGLTARCIGAATRLFIDREIECEILIPSRLFPLDLRPVKHVLAGAGHILSIEEGVAGGAWGAELASHIYEDLWGTLRDRVRIVSSKPSVIPTAAHLERQMLVQEEDIMAAVIEAQGA